MAPETVQHLFFECSYAAGIWTGVSRCMPAQQTGRPFQVEVEDAVRKARNAKKKLFLMLFTEAVYAIWKQRNSRTFCNQKLEPDQVIREILFKVGARCSDVDG